MLWKVRAAASSDGGRSVFASGGVRTNPLEVRRPGQAHAHGVAAMPWCHDGPATNKKVLIPSFFLFFFFSGPDVLYISSFCPQVPGSRNLCSFFVTNFIIIRPCLLPCFLASRASPGFWADHGPQHNAGRRLTGGGKPKKLGLKVGNDFRSLGRGT